MKIPYAEELEVATAVLQVTAKLSQHVLSLQKLRNKGTVQKEDLSIVTVADFAIQGILSTTFSKAFPEDGLVGEESASQLRSDLILLENVYELVRMVDGDDDEEGLFTNVDKNVSVPGSREEMCNLIDKCGASVPNTKGRTWVFDPIDGTKTYVRGELYAINVALLVDGKQVLGAVACPNLPVDAKTPLSNADIGTPGSIIYAIKDHGAFVRPLEGGAEPRKLEQHSSSLPLSDVQFVTCATLNDSALDGVHEAIAEKLEVTFPGCDLLPWVTRWVALALGLGNTTVWVYRNRDRRAKVWDHAGAMLLFEETGGKITDINGDAIDLAVGRKMSFNRGFIAAPGDLHAKVLATVHQVLKEMGHQEYLQ
ncbi:hypothetical protein N3K66_004026 [Trichothecium roseum]|uniref:Uncharacterized protein n=1 Tax=Trichothecium roseum TaxID=47278 RepID=A0ACC0V914_9HYPO|nr:hypothetical protein N3K66_004026 [Trichothecium roseum]